MAEKRLEDLTVEEVEAYLQPPAIEMAPYPAKVIDLGNGKQMVVRQASVDEVDFLLEVVDPLKHAHRDFFDIVSARVYSELLGWKVNRVRNEFCLVGVIDGVLSGIVNSRLFDEKTTISYHTLTLRRGLRIGAHLFAAKMEYSIEYLNNDEVWIVAESPIGLRRWMIEYPLEKRFEIQHELGGAPSWTLTRETYMKAKERLVKGTRPVPADLLASTMKLEKPDLSEWFK